jgi:8-oxo-dGTP pyrophosphatase MutT (NUDIX family)
MSEKSAFKLQYAALPYRRCSDGLVKVMLVTSRGTRRWIIPKGWPAQGLAPHESAAQEAMEEAGLLGQISERPMGSYHYTKRLTVESAIPCEVEVFALEIQEQLASWPEKEQRSTQWFTSDAAADAVDEPELSQIIRKLTGLLV